MTPELVFQVIRAEREYQDRTYEPGQLLQSGLIRAERDKEVTSHILLLEEYALKARQAWVPGGGNLPALREIAKLAAIAVRAMERVGGSMQLLDGLR